MKELMAILLDYEYFCISYDPLLRSQRRIKDAISKNQQFLFRNNAARRGNLEQRMRLLSEQYVTVLRKEPLNGAKTPLISGKVSLPFFIRKIRRRKTF